MNDGVTIIGAGPAGIAAAIQLKRQSIPFEILEKDQVGGLLRNANWVENYPGFPKGISGGELVRRFNEQMKQHNIQVRHEVATHIKWENGIFLVQTNATSFMSALLIVASGTQPKPIPDIPISSEAYKYIHHEAIALQNEKDKEIAIIGSGDAAFDYAMNLSKKNKILILGRRNKQNCLPLLWDRCDKNPNISCLSNVDVKSINWHQQLQIAFSDREGSKNQVNSDLILFAIGREPNLGIFDSATREQIDHLLEKNKLFLIGDVINGHHRQVAISAGDGMRAAMKINDIWRYKNS